MAKKKKVKFSKKQLVTILIVILVVAMIALITYFAAPDLFDKGIDAVISWLQKEDVNEGENGTTTPEPVVVSGAIAEDMKGRIANDDFSTKPSSLATPAASEKLEVHFIDVGQGDSILIRFPDGKDMLIDGADEGTDEKDAILNYLNSVNLDYLDYVMLSHVDSDHVGSLDEVLKVYEARNIFMPQLASSYRLFPEDYSEDTVSKDELNDFRQSYKGATSTKVYYDFYQQVLTEEYNDGVTSLKAKVVFNVGIMYIVGEDYLMTIYCPNSSYYTELNYKSGNSNIDGAKAKDMNNMSPICILEYAGVKTVFTGDADEWAENNFMALSGNQPIDCDILKVGHHGSSDSSNQAFLDYITCEYAVISVGEGNTYGHPTAEALSRLQAQNMNILRTDLRGDIKLTINGNGNFVFDCERAA